MGMGMGVGVGIGPWGMGICKEYQWLGGEAGKGSQAVGDKSE